MDKTAVDIVTDLINARNTAPRGARLHTRCKLCKLVGDQKEALEQVLQARAAPGSIITLRLATQYLEAAKIYTNPTSYHEHERDHWDGKEAQSPVETVVEPQRRRHRQRKTTGRRKSAG